MYEKTNTTYLCTLPNAQLANKCCQTMLELGASSQKKLNVFGSVSEEDEGLFGGLSEDDRLLMVKVEEWTAHDVQHWLTYLTYSDGTSMEVQIGSIFEKEQMNGDTLISLEENTDLMKKLVLSNWECKCA